MSDPGAPAPSRRDALTTAAVTFLLALFWWLSVSASIEKSQTSDELPHIAAGYAYDRFSDFRMQPENGVLPQRIFGLPAVVERARMPIDPVLWRHSSYWQIGWDFFYGSNNLTEWIVLQARALNAFLGVALGGFIFLVARRWYGRSGGLLGLGFYCFAPNFLAHAALATSDLCGALFLAVAPWLFWRHLVRRSAGSGVLAAFASGLMLAAKFNGVLIGPIYLGLAGLEAALYPETGDASRWRRAAANLGLAAVQVPGALAVIWLCFDFRFRPEGPGMPAFDSFGWGNWNEMLAALGSRRHLFEILDRLKLLPEAWSYGLSFVLTAATARPAFFAGEHSTRGWWQFFPTLFLVKTPLATLGALVLAGTAMLAERIRGQGERWRAWAYRVAPVAVPALLAWTAAITSDINIGDRHILPVYPALFIALGSLAKRLPLLGAGMTLLALSIAGSVAIRPDYLADFNALAGGPTQAYKLVADSSLDWGQDLPALRRWLTAHRRPNEKTYLAYFGTAWPPFYDVRPTHFLPTPTYIARPPAEPYRLEPGLYCLSATILDEVYSAYRGPWLSGWEVAYRQLRAGLDGTRKDRLDAQERIAYSKYDDMRLARLCKYLQTRKPDAFAGYSILIFRLDAADLRAALEEPVIGTHRVRHDS